MNTSKNYDKQPKEKKHPQSAWRQILQGKTLYRSMLNVALQDAGLQSGRILDIGGTSVPLPTYRRYFRLAPDARVFTLNIDPASQPDFLADAYHIPQDQKDFDAVWCMNTVEHLAEPQRLFDEIARILKPGGKLIINTPFFFRVHAHPDDYGRYTDSALIFFAEKSGLKTFRMQRVGMGPFLVAAAQVQMFFPRLVFLFLASFAQALDRIIKRIRPSLYESWPLGFLAIFEK